MATKTVPSATTATATAAAAADPIARSSTASLLKHLQALISAINDETVVTQHLAMIGTDKSEDGTEERSLFLAIRDRIGVTDEKLMRQVEELVAHLIARASAEEVRHD